MEGNSALSSLQTRPIVIPFSGGVVIAGSLTV